jgi:ribosomal protein S12 methylthiotransferase
MVDSEVLSGQLLANDIDVVHENKRSDHNIVVVNTCGFIEKAKEESINTILNQVELKRRGKIDKVYVTGCLSERYKKNLEEDIPEVDAYFGTMELPLILKQFEADYKTELVGRTFFSNPFSLCLFKNIRRLQPHLCFLRYSSHEGATYKQTH